MLDTLNAFYSSRGISPVGFRCPFRPACSAGAPHFTEAKASFVGPRYEGRTLPRLLFLSLDSGSGRRDPHSRTVEAVRKRELARDVAALPRNRHWYRTHEMAFKLLRQFEPQAVAVGCQTILRPTSPTARSAARTGPGESGLTRRCSRTAATLSRKSYAS